MKKIFLIAFLMIFGFVLFYSNLPVLNYGFTGFSFILLLLVILAIVFSLGLTVSQQAKEVKLSSKPNKILVVLAGVLLVY